MHDLTGKKNLESGQIYFRFHENETSVFCAVSILSPTHTNTLGVCLKYDWNKLFMLFLLAFYFAMEWGQLTDFKTLSKFI